MSMSKGGEFNEDYSPHQSRSKEGRWQGRSYAEQRRGLWLHELRVQVV